jgi:hypothetical protein
MALVRRCKCLSADQPRMITIATSVVAITIGRLILDPLGL